MCQKAGKKLKAKGYKPTSHYFLIPIVLFAVQFSTAIIISVTYIAFTKGGTPSMGIVYVPALL